MASSLGASGSWACAIRAASNEGLGRWWGRSLFGSWERVELVLGFCFPSSTDRKNVGPFYQKQKAGALSGGVVGGKLTTASFSCCGSSGST